MLKTYEEWEGSLADYLQVGDEVDERMVDYFIGVLPPACMNSECVQMGEPYTHGMDNAGILRAKYLTLKRENGKWYYAGPCFKGQMDQAA